MSDFGLGDEITDEKKLLRALVWHQLIVYNSVEELAKVMFSRTFSKQKELAGEMPKHSGFNLPEEL